MLSICYLLDVLYAVFTVWTLRQLAWELCDQAGQVTHTLLCQSIDRLSFLPVVEYPLSLCSLHFVMKQFRGVIVPVQTRGELLTRRVRHCEWLLRPRARAPSREVTAPPPPPLEWRYLQERLFTVASSVCGFGGRGTFHGTLLLFTKNVEV